MCVVARVYRSKNDGYICNYVAHEITVGRQDLTIWFPFFFNVCCGPRNKFSSGIHIDFGPQQPTTMATIHKTGSVSYLPQGI